MLGLRTQAAHLLSALLLWAASLAAAAAQVSLTAEEQAWLDGRAPLRVATKQEWAPIDTYSYEGQYRGLSGEFLHLIGQRLGVRLEYVALPTLAQGLDALRDGRADIVPSVSRTPRREQFMRFTRPYLDVPNVYVARHGVGRVGENEPMRGLRVAVERGYAVIDVVRELHPQARIVEFDDSANALRGVSQGAADVYLGALPTTTFLVEKLLLTNLEIRTPWRTELSALHLGVRADQPMLQAVLDKALDSITLAERQEIHRRWVPLRTLLAEPSPPLPLSAEERRFAEQMPALRVGFDEAHRPYAFLDAHGQASGMAFDYLSLLTRRLGISLGARRGGTWPEVFALARSREVDLLLAVADNEQRREEFLMVGPWISAPTVLVTRQEAPAVSALRELEGRTVAVLKDGQHRFLLERNYPKVRLLELPTREDLLDAVADGRADGAVSNVSFVVPRLQEGLGAGLKMAGIFPELKSDLYFAVRRDQPMLARLLTRALDSVSDAERAAIAARWAVVTPLLEPNARETLRRAAPWLGALALALLLTLLWGMYLKRQVRRTLAAEHAVQLERDRARALAEARAEFITVASHEIRTPANAVLGALELVSRASDGAAQREMLGLAKRSAATLLAFVNNLLDLSKADAGRLAIHLSDDDVAAALREVVDTLEPTAASTGVVLRLTLDPKLAPRLATDPMRLRQVVMNLVSNALKFTPAGEVRVDAAVVAEDDRSQRVAITVRDTGVGIPAELVDTLFKPYEQAHTGGGRSLGTGLGLALCKRLVDKMGGTIELKSEAGRGTQVRIELPMARGTAPTPASQPLRALVVDDDLVQQMLIRAGLEQLGCVVDVCSNGAEGLQMFRLHRHALVLGDCRMPVMDGYEFARRLRAEPGGDRAFLVGTSADLDDKSAALDSGMLRVVQKPISRAVLTDLVAAVSS